MRDPSLHTAGFYHIYNRGVDKRRIFIDERDYQDFYESLYLYSDANYTNPHGDFMTKASELSGYEVFADDRDPLVRIISFYLSGNHFHFFLEQLHDNGISNFMHKLQRTYSYKFNRRYGRSGTLFESKFKSKSVDNEAYFTHIPRYIHLNALDLQLPEWRTGDIKDWGLAQQILDNDQWSSHSVYMRKSQQLPIVDETFVHALFQSSPEYITFLKEFAGAKSGFEFDF